MDLVRSFFEMIFQYTQQNKFFFIFLNNEILNWIITSWIRGYFQRNNGWPGIKKLNIYFPQEIRWFILNANF